jgi:alkanesulfonate monooxygenase SsuD/methylene tetrahydromethanopterin reductase-like flavin-dependent oxidoreductase (luciferase family)
MAKTTNVHLGVSINGAGHHPAAWLLTPDAGRLFTLDHLRHVVAMADRGGLDFVALDDAFGLQAAGTAGFRGRLDALLAMAAVAPLTRSVGLVAATDVTHTEPFHLSKNVATLDLVSGGRAGWWPRVSASTDVAELFGRKPAAPVRELWDEAADAVEVVRQLWDSWEDDAVIRDASTGRYIDRDKVHYINFRGAFFDVRGPSITPRPPQGQPLVVIAVDDAASLAVAAAHADIALIEVPSIDRAAAQRANIGEAVTRAGREPETVSVLATVGVLLDSGQAEADARRRRLDDAGLGASNDTLSFTGDAAGFTEFVAEWSCAGAVDGFVVRPAVLESTLEQLVEAVVPALVARRVFAPNTSDSLRARFNLSRPPSRYASTTITTRSS